MTAAQNCTIYPTYPYGDGYLHPQAPPSWPSHVTHSWQQWGIGPDPMREMAGAMNRLAAALEKYNEANVNLKKKPRPGKPKPGC